MADVTVTKTLDVRWGVEQPTDPNPALNDGFLFDIDAAIKDKVSDIYASDVKAGANGRLVPAYFRNPPSELRGQVSYPHIIIDRLYFRPARDREQRSEDLDIPYTPKGFTPPPDDRLLRTREAPIPYNFAYQITALSRSYHNDREIQTAMLSNDRFPPRGAYLVVGEEPNQTVRQMFVTEDSPREDSRMIPQEGGTPKRLFRSIWVCTVSGELFQQDLLNLPVATEVSIDVAALETS